VPDYRELHYPGDVRAPRGVRIQTVPLITDARGYGVPAGPPVEVETDVPGWRDGVGRPLRIISIDYDEATDQSTVHLTLLHVVQGT
jgi:hypothetical protein